MNRARQNRRALAMAAAAVVAAIPVNALAGESTNSSGDPTAQGIGTPAITISFSGQTALRTFNNSQGISTLQPNSSIMYNFGPTGASPVTYYASTSSAGYVQLAKKDFTTSDSGLGATSIATAPATQFHSALRVEWHEQGSVQGQFDLINDQIGYVSPDGGATGYISNLTSRGPSVANPTWINNTSFNAAATLNGHTLNGANFANTYDTSVYNRVTGRNLQNGQDRIQFSVGEYKTESLAKNGTASRAATPGTAGYGLGNPVLKTAANTIGLGVAGGRQQFYNESFANESTDKVDPNSTTNAHYASGPWNTAGAYNIDSKQISVTTVAYSANPGTGLSHINRGDSQWLLTTGRLRNGADFNVVIRANDAGQRVIPAISVGVDPSWSVGENDDGNTSTTANANAQKTLGADFRFSGKTSGTEARNAIAQSRLGFGPLSITETRGAASNAPVRALDVDFEHLTDTGNPADFIRSNFDNLVNHTNYGTAENPIYHPTYRGVLISHYNTIKAPRPDLLAAFQSANPGATAEQTQNWWNGLSSANTGIKGDPFGNVAAFINNITNSTGTAAAGITPASANNPADALFGSGFLIPGLLNYSRQFTGEPVTPVTLNPAQLAEQANVKANYGPLFTADGTSGSNAQTIGSSSFYGALNAAGAPAINGAIPITAKDSTGAAVPNGTVAPKGNYLFGNFNQDGRRDFASVKEAVNAALSLRKVDATGGAGAKSGIYTTDGGVGNGTVITSLSGSPGWATTANTKGDLIVLGDFNSDGAFDGKDVYLLARGAALSDNGSTDHLTTASGAVFADQVRNPNAKLNKNAALDYARAQTQAIVVDDGNNAARAFLRSSAQSTLQLSNDPTGANAFNKFDVNRDGLSNRQDAAIVDSFVGKDYRSLDNQLAAVVATNLNPAGTVFVGDPLLDVTTPRKSISLVDVELNDTGTITHVLSGGESDFQLIRLALGTSSLLDGDTDFNGTVDFTDLGNLLNSYNSSGNKWSTGDTDFNGLVDFTDLGNLLNVYNQSAILGFTIDANEFGLDAQAVSLLSDEGFTVVPEPSTFGVIGCVVGAGMLSRRRRARAGR
jgi:hypothetical protein